MRFAYYPKVTTSLTIDDSSLESSVFGWVQEGTLWFSELDFASHSVDIRDRQFKQK